MKSIIYIIIAALFLTHPLFASIGWKENQKQEIKLQADDEHPDSIALSKSAAIIEKRLSDYGLQNFLVNENLTKNSIDIVFNDPVAESEILPLLTSRGKIEFYETLNRRDVIKLLDKDDRLYSLLNISSDNQFTDSSPAILGYCNSQSKSEVDAYLAEHYVSKPYQGIKFLWSQKSNSSGDFYLFLLKHHASMDGFQIQEAGLAGGGTSNNASLTIQFNSSGVKMWQDLTKNNIGKPVAIVIDEAVYSAPQVMSEIKEGKCLISGDYSPKEIMILGSLLNNEELPLEFHVGK